MPLPKPSDSRGEFVVPEPGIYTMEFTKFNGPFTEMWNEQPREKIELFFEIRDDDEYEGVELKRKCGYSMHPTKSHLYPIVCALFGRQIGGDENVDLEDAIGTIVDGSIVNVDRPSKTNPGETVTFANIESIAAKRKRRKKAEADAEAEDDDNPYERQQAKTRKPAPEPDEDDEDDAWPKAS